MKRVLSLLVVLGLTSVLIACADSANDSAITGPTPSRVDSSDTIQARVIYGDDDRKDVHQVSDQRLLGLARATTALIQSAQMFSQGDQYMIATTNFGTDYNLCPGEPFREQDAAAFCSGFLVAPNVMITAGHCIRTETECQKTKFVFDYAVTAPGGVGPRTVPAANVYSCKRLIKSHVVNRGADFAIVELDRNVTGRTPLKVRQSGSVGLNESLVVIGHPSGIPTKIAGGASVRRLDTGFFVANLDTYGGNSGSAVFNNSTGEVEGILVRGENDFVFQGNCRVSKVCANDSCRGEDATYIGEILPFLSSSKRRDLALDFDRRWRSNQF